MVRPIGRADDEVRICSPKVEVLHIYLPTVAFAPLMNDYNLPPVPGRYIRGSWGVQDELINQISLSVLSEMMSPTAAGRMLVELSSLLLAARLAQSHLETELIGSPIQSRHGLDDGRLRRVLAYIEGHLAGDITVVDLANVACLSIFHFTRAFAATMGVPPHRYVSQRRLENAKAMIATGRASLQRDCSPLPVFLAIELHPRVPAGHGRELRPSTDERCDSILGRAHIHHHHGPVDRRAGFQLARTG